MRSRIDAMLFCSFFVSFFCDMAPCLYLDPISFAFRPLSLGAMLNFNRSKLVYFIINDVKNRVKTRLHSLASNNL